MRLTCKIVDMKPSTIQCIIASLEKALQENVATGSMNVDGVQITFRSRAELTQEWQFWQGELARRNGTKPVVSKVRLY